MDAISEKRLSREDLPAPGFEKREQPPKQNEDEDASQYLTGKALWLVVVGAFLAIFLMALDAVSIRLTELVDHKELTFFTPDYRDERTPANCLRIQRTQPHQLDPNLVPIDTSAVTADIWATEHAFQHEMGSWYIPKR